MSSTEEDDEECAIPHNVYFDKQLAHLVLSEEFDFKEISKILSNFSAQRSNCLPV